MFLEKSLNEKFKNKKILVVGFSFRSGLSSCNYLLSEGAIISISDSKKESELLELKSRLIKSPKNFYCGNQNEFQLKNIDQIILSPGVPRSISLIKKAKEKNIPVISEIELAYLASRKCPPKKIIGITGTDGKSTTATLVYEILKREFKVEMAGNIGIPFISLLNKINKNSIIVLELSSYMLEEISYLRCDIACLLNVAEDHMDRYPNFETYLRTKFNIFKYQTEKDISILNSEASFYKNYLKNYSKKFRGKIIEFSNSKKSQCYFNDPFIYFKGEKIKFYKNKVLNSSHNLENILAAVCICKSIGSSNEVISYALTLFKGLAHRHEFIRSVNGIKFINDSKATTVNAVLKAIKNYSSKIILLMGGINKGLNFNILNKELKYRVKFLILFGQDAEKINYQLKFNPIHLTDTLENALNKALEIAVKDDIVLLSPACSSFDQYNNYEERGRHFCDLVNCL